MTIKFTKSEVETIIKEEVSKLINEQGAPQGAPLSKYGAGLKVELSPKNMEFVVSAQAFQKVENEFDSLISALKPVIDKYRAIANQGIGTTDIRGFDLLTTQVLQRPQVWKGVLKKFGYGSRSPKIYDGAQGLIPAGIEGIFSAVERFDNSFDDLDPYDGYAGSGFGRAKSGMDADQRFAYLYMRNGLPNVSPRHEYPDALVTTFINWLFGKEGGAAAPAPAPVPSVTKPPEEVPPVTPEKPPEQTQNTGGGGGPDPVTLAIEVTGISDGKQAVAEIQSILVELGFPIGSKKMPGVLKTNQYNAFLAAEKGPFMPQYNIIGVYGPRTRAAVRQFQKKNTGLKVDGIVGKNTWGKMMEYAESDKNQRWQGGQGFRSMVAQAIGFKSAAQKANAEPEVDIPELEENKDLATLKEHFTKWNKLWD